MFWKIINESKNVWIFQVGKANILNQNSVLSRSRKIVDELIKNGHSVTVWASLFDHPEKKWIFKEEKVIEVNPHFRVRYIKGLGYKKNFSFRRFLDHRLIAYRVLNQIRKEDSLPDVALFSMPPYDLADKVVRFLKEKGIPSIVDIRDPWHDYFVEPVHKTIKPLVRLCLTSEFLTLRRLLRNATSVVSMMDSLLSWGYKSSRRQKNSVDKVFRLGYGKPCRNLSLKNKASKYLDQAKGQFVVSFVGVVSHFNNPEIFIHAAEKYDNPEISYFIAGDGDALNGLRLMVESKNLKNIYFLGWLNSEEANTLLRGSDLGVCSTNKKEESFPNKFFMYTSVGLPVLSCIKGELSEFICKK